MDLNNTTTPPAEQDLAQTPWWFVKAVENWQGSKFTLDVCANAATAKCEAYYSLDEMGLNSLVLPWSTNNWCNPPYSNVMPWVQKARKEAKLGNRSVLLIPDKPEVACCRAAWTLANAVYHMPFRLNFLRPDGSQFTDKDGKKQGPKFPVWLCVFDSPEITGRPFVDYVDLRLYIDGSDNNGGRAK